MRAGLRRHMGLAPQLEPEPEPELEESADEKAPQARSERLSRLTADGAMGKWSEAQVSEWISLIDLPDGCAQAVQAAFSDMDGAELLNVSSKMLRKMLRFAAGLEQPEPVAEAILRQRDSVMSDTKPAAGTAEAPECPFCMEPYAEDESELHVPRILQCGHTACQDCFARMLRPIAADGDVKNLECPTCRVVTAVRRGRAANMPKNFSLLR